MAFFLENDSIKSELTLDKIPMNMNIANGKDQQEQK